DEPGERALGADQRGGQEPDGTADAPGGAHDECTGDAAGQARSGAHLAALWWGAGAAAVPDLLGGAGRGRPDRDPTGLGLLRAGRWVSGGERGGLCPSGIRSDARRPGIARSGPVHRGTRIATGGGEQLAERALGGGQLGPPTL